ncbi:DNA-directed RNA polymerase III subunit RPC7 [Pelodytes ibericus]
MAGKGRGRGASFTFDLQAIGISKGEALPETRLQPIPTFPPVDYKPVPLKIGEDMDYMLALKQEIRGNVKRLPYYVPAELEKPRVEKYRTKYEIEAEQKLIKQWIPDWRLLPMEMKVIKKKTKKPKKAKVKETKPSGNEDILKKIEELEKKGDEEKSDEEKEEKKEGEEEEEVEADLEEEEEHEEENDYIASYFEDGDDFGGSDDNMDEATY